MNLKLKKALKITGITLGSLLGLIIILVALVCILVFTSPGLTTVAEKAIDKFSPARAKIDNVDLTLVKSYPFLAFRLNGLVIYDDMEESPSDTLAAIDKLAVTVDFKTLYKERKIILTNLYVDRVLANVYTAADGRSNLDVFGSSQEKEKPEKDDDGMDIYADLQKISIENVSASYIDIKSGINAGINDIDLELKGLLNYDSLEAKTTIKVASVKAAIKNDSIDGAADMTALKLNGNLTKYGDDVDADVTITLKGSTAKFGTMDAALNDLKFIADNVSFALGKDGFKDLVAGLNLTASDLSFSSDGMSTTTGKLSMKADKAVFTGDSINVSGFNFDSRTISLELEDSVGTLTKAGIDKVLLDIEGALKLDMSNVNSNLALNLEGTRFEQGGESPISVITDNVSFNADGKIQGDFIALNSVFATPSLNVTMGNDVYVPGWSLSLNVPLETNKNIDRFAIKEGANVNIDGQQIGFSANGTLGGKQAVAGRARIRTVHDLDIDRLISMIPDAFKDALDGIDVHGILGLDLNVKGAMGDNGPVLDDARAQLSLKNLDATLNDSLKAASGKLSADITYPSKIAVDKDRETADVILQAADLEVSIIDSTTINASFDNLDLNASVAGLTEETSKMNILLDLRAEKLKADMDTIFGSLDNADISITVAPAESTTAMMANVSFNGLSATMGSLMSATLGNTTLLAMAQHDESKEDMLLKWDPRIKMTFEDGQLDMLDEPILLPQLDFDFSLGRFNINDCRVEIDNSDIMLWGDVYNIGEYLDGTGLLTGELYLESDYVDINKILALTGSTDDEVEAAEQVVSEVEAGQDTIDAGPIMIPKGIDLTLYTNLSEVGFNDHTFNNVGGDVTVRDGVIILKELGFSSNAAEMQLTAIYKTPSVERRYMELDFHLLDIEIDELIDLIPAVDSVVPMLKSFEGKAQFHLAAETYLEPDVKLHGDFYPIMYSLMGAAAIEGKDLVVLDNEVFNSIKKKLLMGKDARNVIDSLDVELQVLDGKVDLYPTRIAMGNYEAIISGRHNIDKSLSCSYNVSLVKCPLPIRLGVTISGPLDDIAKFPIRHIDLGLAKYDKLYKPGKQGKAEETILRMKNDILNTLRSNVR
jgi:hypothetical protein